MGAVEKLVNTVGLPSASVVAEKIGMTAAAVEEITKFPCPSVMLIATGTA